MSDLPMPHLILPTDSAPELVERPALRLASRAAEIDHALFERMAAAPPYPMHALGPLQPVAEAIHDVTMAPLAICAQSVLGVASLVAQRHYNVQTLSGAAPTSLYLLTVAESGERKSSCDALLMPPIRRHERSEKKDLKLQSFSLAGLLDALVEEGPALALMADEGGQVLAGNGMSGSQRAAVLATLNSLWEGGVIKRTLKTGSPSLFDRRLCAHIMVQPKLAEALLASKGAHDIGFLPRFLMAWPRSAIGSRPLSQHGPDHPELVRAHELISDRLARAIHRTDDGGIQPDTLRLTRAARDILEAFYLEVEGRIGQGCDWQPIRAAASKLTEQAARLAGVLTAWSRENPVEIDGTTMAQAVELARFYGGEALRLAGHSAPKAGLEDAEVIRAWLASHRDVEITVRNLVQQLPRPLRNYDRVTTALVRLERLGHLVRAKPKPGRRAISWETL